MSILRKVINDRTSLTLSIIHYQLGAHAWTFRKRSKHKKAKILCCIWGMGVAFSNLTKDICTKLNLYAVTMLCSTIVVTCSSSSLASSSAAVSS